ncbi:phospholipase C [Tahibacter aquaticus]|uniref:phospholipase C n=1 Tax=Tahibacter aquaticus TaxID=520092 RepID=A0A4R6YVA6_9GAMM|nr:phospholipase C, phosphocholine-specific [Tahibacter aquaticus]TDR42603.1 phospholipase C [Tahibacter aquaticus]
MAGTNRREFLRLAAQSAGAAAIMAALPPAIREALATPAARVTGTINDVEHVVVLMQENRSFDHYFGTLRGVRGFDDPRVIRIPGGADVWQQPRNGSGTTPPFRLDTTLSGAQCMDDIDHSWKGTHTRWKAFDRWVREKGNMCMGHFARADLPFYHALADAFTVCDAWFCSIHGPTNPNRMHLFTGTSGLAVNRPGNHAVNNVDDGNWTADMSRDNAAFAAYDWMTYAERLQNAGVSWKVYQEYDNYGDNSLAYFRNFRGIATSSPLYARGRAYAPGSNASNAYTTLGLPLIEQFRNDVQNGTLPQVSWLVAPFSMCEHPEAAPAYGERLTAQLLAALAANPAVWSKTVFIITYDENGGYFDHIPSHVPALTAAQGLSTVATGSEDHAGVPVGLGIRVPTLIVSPWSRGGWVNSQVFDHTSVIRFLEARFGVSEPNIGAWRRAMTGDLTSAFDFSISDVQWPPLPDTSHSIANADLSCQLAPANAPAAGVLPAQEAGQRPARALPYELNVNGRVEASSGRYWLDFYNDGAAGAGFNVYSYNRSDGPWYYSLEGGTTLSDYWSAQAVSSGIYDLEVHGPNGFLRGFGGDVALAIGGANPELTLLYDSANHALMLRLRNTGTAACRVSLAPNRYSSAAVQQFELAAGATLDTPWQLNATSRWYDLSLRSDHDARWLRRFAGHLENGLPGVSDPAFGSRGDKLFGDAFEAAAQAA